MDIVALVWVRIHTSAIIAVEFAVIDGRMNFLLRAVCLCDTCRAFSGSRGPED